MRLQARRLDARRAVACIGLLVAAAAGCTKEQRPAVVVYTALDPIFSEPILAKFEQRSGIRVLPTYDVEAVKTTGLVNRIIEERRHPRCDVFWNNEIIRTIVLKRKGCLVPYKSPSARDIPPRFKDPAGYWTGFAARARVILCNTDMVPAAEMPTSIYDLAQPRWRGQVAVANPLFGTTATHCAALFASLGPQRAKEFLLSLKRNGAVIVAGNAVARDQVADGELKLCLTDTDDSNSALLKNKPVRMIYPDQDGMGTLLIPNTVALVAGAPHPREAKRLIDFLLSEEVEQALARCKSAQIPLRPSVRPYGKRFSVAAIRRMNVDYEAVADALEESTRVVREQFLRRVGFTR